MAIVRKTKVTKAEAAPEEPKKKAGSQEEVLYVRISKELKEQIEAFQEAKAEEVGMRVSLSVAVRMLLQRALK